MAIQAGGAASSDILLCKPRFIWLPLALLESLAPDIYTCMPGAHWVYSLSGRVLCEHERRLRCGDNPSRSAGWETLTSTTWRATAAKNCCHFHKFIYCLCFHPHCWKRKGDAVQRKAGFQTSSVFLSKDLSSLDKCNANNIYLKTVWKEDKYMDICFPQTAAHM